MAKKKPKGPKPEAREVKPDVLMQELLDTLTEDQCDSLIGKSNDEYMMLSAAFMAHNALLQRALAPVMRRDVGLRNAFYSSFVVLGTLIRRTYALGIDRGGMRAGLVHFPVGTIKGFPSDATAQDPEKDSDDVS